MKRGEVCRVAERGETCGRWRGEEGHGVANVLDSGHGVGNGVGRECVDIVVDGVDKLPAHVPTPDTNNGKKSTKPTTRTLQQLQPELEPTTATTMAMAIIKWVKQEHSHAGTIITPLANKDPKRQYAVGNSMSRNVSETRREGKNLATPPKATTIQPPNATLCMLNQTLPNLALA